MEAADNPFRPGAGTRPPTLAGREKHTEVIRTLLASVQRGGASRPLLFHGVRGVGKTVLLGAAAELAERRGYCRFTAELSSSDDFRDFVARAANMCLGSLQVSKSIRSKLSELGKNISHFSVLTPDGIRFEIGVRASNSDASATLESDVVALFMAIGESAAESGTACCLVLDEVQHLSPEALAALIGAIHRVGQRELPIAFVCAGLPQVIRQAAEAKSYAERLFEFVEVGRLSNEDTERALREALETNGVGISDEAIAVLVLASEGYPHLIQELGSSAWRLASKGEVEVQHAEDAVELALDALKQTTFDARLRRADYEERRFMLALANAAPGFRRLPEIASALGIAMPVALAIKESLEQKGLLIESTTGDLVFTVPHFGEFLRRHVGTLSM